MEDTKKMIEAYPQSLSPRAWIILSFLQINLLI